MSGKRNLKAKKAAAKESLDDARHDLKSWLRIDSDLSDQEIVVLSCEKLMRKVHGKIDIKSQVRFLAKLINRKEKDKPEWKSHMESIMLEK